MRYCIFDIETDGLLHEVTKIHCLSYCILDDKGFEIKSDTIIEYRDIILFLLKQECLIGHNIIRYDLPVLYKLLGLNLSNIVQIDTLSLSWYLYPFLPKHGLESWGKRLGTEKPEINDWIKGSIEDYTNRCQEDVVINTKLFVKQWSYLTNIYKDNDPMNIIKFLNFKMECLRDQEDVGITLDEELCTKTILDIEYEFQQKTLKLQSVIPRVESKKRPKKFYKKGGEISAEGMKYLKRLQEEGLPEETETITTEGNPGSHIQLKDWMFSLGWKPITFKENDKKEEIPQISLPFGQGLCQSVKDLYEVEPELSALEDYYMLRHRKSVLEGFLKNARDGKIYASASGFTQTTRLQHKVVVNLPAVGKAYGAEIRGCLKVPNEDYVFIGSDICGLESATGDHFMYMFDPEYVKEKRVEGFDPHLDLGKLANLITAEEEKFFKNFDAIENPTEEEQTKYKSIKKRRTTSKTSSFCMMYGGGIPKVSTVAKISINEASILYKAYWERNKAVKMIADNCTVKTVNGQQWLYNPISNYWCYLKSDKDRFSALNQSAGSYVFNVWLKNVKNLTKEVEDFAVLLEYHDEIGALCLKKDTKKVLDILQKAMDKTNETLKLNVIVEIDSQVGSNYADVH